MRDPTGIGTGANVLVPVNSMLFWFTKVADASFYGGWRRAFCYYRTTSTAQNRVVNAGSPYYIGPAPGGNTTCYLMDIN